MDKAASSDLRDYQGGRARLEDERSPQNAALRYAFRLPRSPAPPVFDPRPKVGAGWLRTGEVSGREYVSLSLAAPEFGPRRILANLGRAAGQDDETSFSVIYNPRT